MFNFCADRHKIKPPLRPFTPQKKRFGYFAASGKVTRISAFEASGEESCEKAQCKGKAERVGEIKELS